MITLVAGARPNFVKLAPIVRELQRRSVPFRWVHTGQHHGAMSDPFLKELELPPPDVELGAAGTHAEMVAGVMVGVERELLTHRPDWLVVLGDVDGTLGAALAAVKLGVRIAHVEAGYRSHDWTMPEEVNRVLVDRMSDLLLTPDPHIGPYCHNCGQPVKWGLGLRTIRDASEGKPSTTEGWVHDDDRLDPTKRRCGSCPIPCMRDQWDKRPGARAVLVGNVMMDSLRWALEHRLDPYLPWDGRESRPNPAYHEPPKAPEGWSGPSLSYGGVYCDPCSYAVLTVHRPSNVDSDEDFDRVSQIVRQHAKDMKVVWPSHPRTRDREITGVERVEPKGYLDMLRLIKDAKVIITDSGGVLEEAMYLGMGKEIVSLRDPEKNERQHLLDAFTAAASEREAALKSGAWRLRNGAVGIPEIWKTNAAPRIVDALLEER